MSHAPRNNRIRHNRLAEYFKTDSTRGALGEDHAAQLDGLARCEPNPFDAWIDPSSGEDVVPVTNSKWAAHSRRHHRVPRDAELRPTDLPETVRLAGPLSGILGSILLAGLGLAALVFGGSIYWGLSSSPLPTSPLLVAGIMLAASGGLLTYSHIVSLHEAEQRIERLASRRRATTPHQ